MPRKQRVTPATMAVVNAQTKGEPRCNICNSPSRKHVDKLLAAGFSPTSIAEELQLLDEDFRIKQFDTVRKNVERHAKRHVNVKDRAVREIIEARARESGILVETATGTITTGRALLDILVQKATEQAGNPDSRVKYADAIEAVKMLEDLQRSEYIHELEVLQRQVWAISQAVKDLVPEEQFPALAARAEEYFNSQTTAELAPVGVGV
jgi:hypothetical protein